jgi:hypothetical protein
MEPETPLSHGKYEQQKLLSGKIEDDTLEQFLALNMKHLGLTRGANQDEDVSLISWFSKKKFLFSLELFHRIGVINLCEPEVLPYIKNVINEYSPKIPLQPKGFKGVLYPPQAAMITRMLELETMPITFKLGNGSITFTGGIVNERLSFGKTFCIPALICEKPVIENCTRIVDKIKTNLVICGTKAAKTWKDNLKNLTELSFIVVERANHLDELSRLCDEGNYPTVLVVKDGDITWKNKKDKAYTHVMSILKDKTFTRAFFDDYDMLNFGNMNAPDALFTWFISGTDDGRSNSNISFYHYDEKWNKSDMGIKNARTILDAVSSVSCNREYSVVEYNIPKINEYYLLSSSETGSTVSLFDYITQIVNGDIIEDLVDGDDHPSPSLLTGTKDVPYVYNRDTMKMLVAVESKDAQKVLVSSLNNAGIKAVKLTRANVDKFTREDTTVCVCGNLFGVNMPFLTHIVICVNDFAPHACTQIIGRGQRISRKQNLQVYMFEK